MWFTYIIRNDVNNRFYIGSTNNIKRRLKEHSRSKRQSIAHFGTYRLIYKEEYTTRSEAFQRERQIKAYKGGNAFKKLLREKADLIV